MIVADTSLIVYPIVLSRFPGTAVSLKNFTA